MTNVTISPNRLTSSGKLDSRAMPDGSLRPTLLGRMDISMVADGANLLGSPANINNWEFNVQDGGNLKKYTDAGTPFARGVYNGAQPWNKIFFTLPAGGKDDLYIQYWARKNGDGGGSKMVKVYGIIGGDGGYSNATFAMNYASGFIDQVGFGDGTGLTNDTQVVASLHTDSTSQGGRAGSLTKSFVRAGEFTNVEWGDGTQWHKFNLRLKQSSGTTSLNEVNDGIIEIWIDGVLRGAAYNVFNKYYSNAKYGVVEFLSYTQGSPSPFTLDIKNVTISENGWVD